MTGSAARRAVVGACAAAALTCFVPTIANAAPIVQLPGSLGCLRPGGVGGCGDSGTLGQPLGMAMAPDGRTLYVANAQSDSIVIFDRNPATGQLTRRAGAGGCVRQGGGGGCIAGRVLDNVGALAISPDGSRLYAVANGATEKGVAVFARAPNGSLSQAGTASGCFTQGGAGGCGNGKGMPGPSWLAISPDGATVYVTSTVSSPTQEGFLAVLRVTGSGLSQDLNSAASCFSNDGNDQPTGCLNARQLADTVSVAVAPNGRHVYVTSWTSQSVVAFARTTAGADRGALSRIDGAAGCVQASGLDSCRAAPTIRSETAGIAFRGDTHVYVSTRDGSTIQLFDRDPDGGGLTPRAGAQGCISEFAAFTQCTRGRRLFATQRMSVTPDGRTLVAAAIFALGITTYDLAPNGGMTPVAGPLGCAASSGTGACTPWRGEFTTVFDTAVSPDGKFVYASAEVFPGFSPGPDGILAFHRDSNVPVCANRSASTTVGTVVRIKVSCTDADGDPLTLSAAAPANGVVGGINSGAQTIDFAPSPGFVGRAAFTYRATGGGRSSAPATVTVDVSPSGPPDGPPACQPRAEVAGNGVDEDCDGVDARRRARLNPTVRPLWAVFAAGHTVLREMRIERIARGARVEIRCSGRGCPFARKRFAVKRRRAEGSRPFRGRKLRPGTIVQVRVTKPGAIGKVVTYKIRRRGLPRGIVRCLPPGAKKPARC